MQRVVVKLTPGAVPALLKSEAIQRRLAEEAKDRAGTIPDVEIEPPFVGHARARQVVRAQTPAAAEALKRAFRRR